MDICGVTKAAIHPVDHVPWFGYLEDSGEEEIIDELDYFVKALLLSKDVVLISEWYALVSKHVAQMGRVWRYIVLGNYFMNSKADNVAETNLQFVYIKNIIIPPPDHPSRTFALIELFEPAQFKKSYIRPLCLPFMERIHHQNIEKLVISTEDRSLNVTRLDRLGCQQELLVNGNFLEENNFCATHAGGSKDVSLEKNLHRQGVLFQTRVQFGYQLRYFLYGLNVHDNTRDLKSNLGVYQFKKMELTDLEWILENMMEKGQQTSFPNTTTHERVNLQSIQVLRSKRNLFNFATCGVSLSGYPRPWLGSLLCRIEYDGWIRLPHHYTVTLVSEWYAVGPAMVDGDCFKNGEESSNIAVFGHPCFEDNETKSEETKIIDSCDFPSQQIAIKEILVHPQFNEINLLNNIALIRLAAPANTSLPNVKPICLPIIDTIRSYYTSSLIMASFDKPTKTHNITPMGDRYVDLAECQKRWKHRNVTIDKTIHCVRNKRTLEDECVHISHGDSLHSRQRLGSNERNFLRGFAFNGTKHCSLYFPALFTSTDANLNWMLETMEPPQSQQFDLQKELVFSN